MRNNLKPSSSWKWSIALGILLLVIGFVALGNMLAATMASAYMIGIMMLVGGIFQFLHGLQHNPARKWFWITCGILYAIAGLTTMANPLFVSTVLTLTIGILLVITGISRLFSLPKEAPARGWLMLSGILTLILGIILVLGWPANSFWALGLFLGIDLVFQGWSFLILGLALKTRQ